MLLTQQSLNTVAVFESCNTNWDTLSFEEVQNLLISQNHPYRFSSPRILMLNMITKLGTVTSVLSSKSLVTDINNLSAEYYFNNWDKESEIIPFIESIACIFIYLSILCDYFHLHISNALNDKLIKNAKKYPVHLVKGSSAKYTEYVDQIALETRVNNENNV